MSTVALAACTGEAAKPKALPTGKAVPAGGCQQTMRSGKLPEWARAGFTHGTADHFVLGGQGRILGVVFGHPLTARTAPEPGRKNKVRWIPRDMKAAEAAGTLRITAVPAGGGRTVKREVDPWPGPSLIDMPAAGCWTFTLRWGGSTDTVDLRYRAGPHSR